MYLFEFRAMFFATNAREVEIPFRTECENINNENRAKKNWKK